jgi:Actin
VVPNLGAKPKGEKRLFIADEVATLGDTAQLSLRRPVDRGFVVNTQLQKDIWERVFKHLLKVCRARLSHCRTPLVLDKRRVSVPRCLCAFHDLRSTQRSAPSLSRSRCSICRR